MFHITEVKVEGLAGRDKPYHHKLDRYTNIFFGLNGTGKTSLLKILHSALDNDTEILQGVPFDSAEVTISFDKENSVTKRIERAQVPVKGRGASNSRRSISRLSNIFTAQLSLDQKSMTSWETLTSSTESLSDISFPHQYLPTSRLYSGVTVLSRFNPETNRNTATQLNEEELDTYFADSIERLWQTYSARVLAQVKKTQEQGLVNILRTVFTPQPSGKSTPEIDPSVAYARLSDFLKRQGSPKILPNREQFNKIYHDDIRLRRIVTDVDTVEQIISVSLSPTATISSLIQSLFTGKKSVNLSESGEISVVSAKNQEIGLSSLSSGEKHAIRIFIETLLADSYIIIVDEPELSLHIDWQKDLIKNMRSLNKDVQIIFATHSPEIMADVADDKIFRV